MNDPILPHFTPVPRATLHHQGWTPGRQKAFIEALAESSSPTRAARCVNMSVQSAYSLRRHPQGEEFRAAWNAAVDCGIARLKDVALQRAIEGELVPVFQKGLLVGYRRKFNDWLLMFLLRQYATDADGKRVTVSYTRTRADAIAGASTGVNTGAEAAAASAEASTVTVRTSQSAPARTDNDMDSARATLDGFIGVELDDATHAELAIGLADSAADARAIADTIHDPELPFIRTTDLICGNGALEPVTVTEEPEALYHDGSPHWTMIGVDDALKDRAEMIAMIERGFAGDGTEDLGVGSTNAGLGKNESD
jgi:hypothetical protein